jgi:hypothetical protein
LDKRKNYIKTLLLPVESVLPSLTATMDIDLENDPIGDTEQLHENFHKWLKNLGVANCLPVDESQMLKIYQFDNSSETFLWLTGKNPSMWMTYLDCFIQQSSAGFGSKEWYHLTELLVLKRIQTHQLMDDHFTFIDKQSAFGFYPGAFVDDEGGWEPSTTVESFWSLIDPDYPFFYEGLMEGTLSFDLLLKIGNRWGTLQDMQGLVRLLISKRLEWDHLLQALDTYIPKDPCELFLGVYKELNLCQSFQNEHVYLALFNGQISIETLAKLVQTACGYCIESGDIPKVVCTYQARVQSLLHTHFKTMRI